MKSSRKSLWALWCVLVLLSTAACSVEKSDWKAANNHPSAQAFEQFLTKYPNGPFSDAAGQKLEELRYRDAAGFNTLDSYQSFLKQYPSGRFAEQARQAIDALDWGTAQKEGSALAWQKYLSAHSTGGHSGEAKAFLDAITSARSPEFKNVQTVAIIVHLTFTEEVKDVVIGFEPVLEEFFPYFGVRKSEPGSQADAAITVVSEAQPLSENYAPVGIPFGGTAYYTGAAVSGNVVVNAAGKKRLEEDFTGEVPCPSTTSGSQPNPSDAPFEEAMEDGFPRQAALVLARAFGFRPMIDALSSGSDRVAKASVAALERGGDAAQTLLAEALSRSNPKVQLLAAEALRGHRNPGAVGLLISCLEKDGEENKALRETAAESLAKLGAVGVPSLELSCKDIRPSVREAAARALGGIRTTKSMSLLAALLDDSAKPVVSAAIDALGEHRSLAAITLLIDRLGGPADDTREAYVAAVEKSAPPESGAIAPEELNPDFSWTGGLVTRLIQIIPLLESRPALLDKMCGVLNRIGDPAIVPLIQALKSERVSVRQSAVDVLGRIGDDMALRPLDASANDPEKSVRLAVAKALSSSFADARAVQTLARLLLDKESDIRELALTGLKSAAAASDSTAEFQHFLSSSETLRALVAAMDIPDASKAADRDAASEILGKVGKSAVEALTACLKSQNRFLREGAVSALGTTRDERAVAALLALAGESGAQADNAMMTKIYAALGASKNRKALDVLTQGLAKDQDQGRRSAAAAALGELGDIRAVDSLIAALDAGKTALDTTIQEAIQKLTDFTPEGDGFDWKAWWAQNRRRFGLKRP